MKINAATSIYAVEQYRSMTNKASENTKAAQTKDHIEISEEAVSFSEVFKSAKAAIEDGNAINKTEIEAIKEQVSNGTYGIDDDALAESILFSIWG